MSQFLKQPHDFEYEKTFFPCCLLSKKRYVSIKYETDPNKGKRDQMGLVLKRRDNAPIVKDVYGGVIDILMTEQNLKSAIDFVHRMVQDLVNGNVDMEKLVITKSLRSGYAKPQQIAHKVLADRIAERDPGNKPNSGDRIPYVFIVPDAKTIAQKQKLLTGDRIELPTYVREHGLTIDYAYYITNQIMNPILQLMSLVLEGMYLASTPVRKAAIANMHQFIEKTTRDLAADPKKCQKKIESWKQAEVKKLLFDKYLTEMENKRNRNQSIFKFTVAGGGAAAAAASSFSSFPFRTGTPPPTGEAFVSSASASAAPPASPPPLKTTFSVKAKPRPKPKPKAKAADIKEEQKEDSSSTLQAPTPAPVRKTKRKAATVEAVAADASEEAAVPESQPVRSRKRNPFPSKDGKV